MCWGLDLVVPFWFVGVGKLFVSLCCVDSMRNSKGVFVFWALPVALV